jgi:hypothetical protein
VGHIFKAAGLWLGLALLGGTAFWLPATAVPFAMLQHRSFAGMVIYFLAITILPILAIIFLLKALSGPPSATRSKAKISASFLLGIWAMGSFWMGLFSEKGFLGHTLRDFFIFHVLLSIPATFMMSAYWFTMPALIVMTIYLAVVIMRDS